MRFDLNEGFPLVTTKKVHLKSIIQELLWFLTGSSNNNWLKERGVTIWDEWAREDGDLGPGVRRAVAQLADAGRRPHRPDPAGDRHAQDQPRFAPHHRERVERGRALEDGADALPRLLPVLRGAAAGAGERGKLSCQLYQRSADIFLGVPFNIASYALLTHMIAQQCDLDVGDFIWTGGDCHIYSNHAEQVALQLSREPYPYPDAGHQAQAGIDLRLRVRGLRGARLPAPRRPSRRRWPSERMTRINLILARAANGVIGRDGAMPWHLPEDMAHFKQQTAGAPVIMGRKTWDSLPPRFRPLPGRAQHRRSRASRTGRPTAPSAPPACARRCRSATRQPPEVWVIGGAQIYAEAEPLAQRAVVTEIGARLRRRRLGAALRRRLARDRARVARLGQRPALQLRHLENTERGA